MSSADCQTASRLESRVAATLVFLNRSSADRTQNGVDFTVMAVSESPSPMRLQRIIVGLSLCLCVLAVTSGQTADLILVPSGAVWRYNDSGTNLGTAWRAVSYNDAAWATGPAQLGYGDGDEATILSWGSNSSNRRITYYFRRSFTVTDASTVASLVVRFIRDDGCVIYLNGVEIARSNMPTGTINYLTRATTAVGGADENAWQEVPVDPSRLVAGTNVIAVELHQQSPTSSDISFNLELRATETQTQVPTVSLMAPADHAVTNVAAVTFTAAATASAGLSSATLHIGDPPKTVVFSGPQQIEDAQIVADTPTIADGGGLSLNVDGQTPHVHALMTFPSLIGAGAGQVPAGASISSATVQLNCTNAGQAMRLYRLTESWSENEATWNQRSNGVPWTSPGADGAGSNAGIALTGDCTAIGQRSIDVTQFLQEWSGGAPNHGIVLIESGTDGVDFDSSESSVSPVLTVVYKNALQPIETTPVAGTSAQLSFPTTLTLGRAYRWNVRVTDTRGQQSWAPSDFELTTDPASPDQPVLIEPSDGATGVSLSPTLRLSVSDPGGGSMSVNVALRKAAAPEFTIIALPDTQHYSESFPAVFTSQTQWIVNNKAARNIVFVTHEGDIVEHNSLDLEWQRANTSLSLLDGVVPYGMGPGNHDLPTTLFNQYFPYTRYQGLPWYGGHYQNLNDNNYQLFSAGGMDFVIAHLIYCPPSDAVAWADSVFKAYPDHIGIMTTHAYLGLGAVRSTHGCGSTQFLWDDLAVPNPNLQFMLSGHVHGEARRTDVVNGRTVFQMLADYQDRATGGEGWLRILRFVPADNTIYVQTYSPWLNQFETDADSEFSLDFPMAGTFATVGTQSMPSGSTVSVPLSALEPNTQYEWRATVTNEAGGTRIGPVWRFTTSGGGPINQPPTANSQSVTTNEDTSAIVTLTGLDPEGQPLTYTIASHPAHGTLSGAAPSLIYLPAANYAGADSFTFRVNDGQRDSNVATITIDVSPQNDPPVSAGESYGVMAGSVLTVSAPGVLGNDSDVESASLQAQLATAPTHGALTLNANGSFTYTPATGYSGPDSFSYVASDGAATSGQAVVSLTVNPAGPPPSGLVAAYSFNEGSGTALIDRTGSGRTGTLSGPTWTTSGKFGGALSFDGTNDWVTIADANSLDLTNGMTLEAWVRPSALSGYPTVILKEMSGGLAYGLYAYDSAPRPAGYVTVAGSDVGASGTSNLLLNTWTHLALTYNGSVLRLFVNGAQVASRTLSGSIQTSTGALRIGGNAVWGGEFFSGLIDDVRIYNRALTQIEIQTDMTTAVTP